MPNNYFSFKQFTIYQDRCAMKVCTDACIQGAFTASLLHNKVKNILDIGSGTGLLSLMLAQNSSADITALETDENAFLQSKENFNLSDWSSKLFPIQNSLQNFISPLSYDWIISNPPFYENDLSSPDEKKNAAMHSTTLKLDELLSKIVLLLSINGLASVMIPHHRKQYFEKLLQENLLHTHIELSVKQTPLHPVFRNIFIFGKQRSHPSHQTLIIQENGNYTEAFQQLLKPYYMNL